MKKQLWTILALTLTTFVCSFALLSCSNTERTETGSAGTDFPERSDETETETTGPRLLYMGQASIRIVTPDGHVVYIDPYAGDGYDLPADLILVTHGHYDHNGTDRVTERNPGCEVITWREALEGGEHRTFDLGWITVEAVEAGYNRWHDARECVGYIVTIDGVSVYVTGDTSTTEQMASLAERNIDYAFYCCDGVFNMDLDEAAECARTVGAKHNIPYHVTASDNVFFDRERAERFDAPNRLIVAEGEEIVLNKDETDGPETTEDGMRVETYTLGTEERILAFIPESAAGKKDGEVPMVLNLHWSGGTPEEQVSENGWDKVAAEEGFIMIAPFYESWDSVYRHTDYFAEIVRDAVSRYPMIDRSRVYVTGFSNGGAAAVALTDQFPELFTAIAPQGWMVGMRDSDRKGREYDMPFQIIQGSEEYTYQTASGAMAIMRDEQEALADLMRFNEMTDPSFIPDYDAAPYWGYPEDSRTEEKISGRKWTVSDYYKDGWSGSTRPSRTYHSSSLPACCSSGAVFLPRRTLLRGRRGYR